jgi:CheY-like chemotaxis protein
MPIMDGYETSLRLAQFYDNYDNKPMVYALSADNSEECFEKVAEFPFNYKLE